MCINFNGYHSGGSSFLNVNDCWLLQKLFVYHKYKVSSEKRKKKNKESQYMVSHPETGSDSPIGSDRDRGRDTPHLIAHTMVKPTHTHPSENVYINVVCHAWTVFMPISQVTHRLPHTCLCQV